MLTQYTIGYRQTWYPVITPPPQFIPTGKTRYLGYKLEVTLNLVVGTGIWDCRNYGVIRVQAVPCMLDISEMSGVDYLFIVHLFYTLDELRISVPLASGVDCYDKN